MKYKVMREPGFIAKDMAKEYGLIDEVLQLEDINKSKADEKKA